MFEIHPITVSLSHIDGYAHVNNAVYISYIQSKLAEILVRLGYAKDWCQDLLFTWSIPNIAIEYHQPAYFGDVLQVSLGIEHSDNREIVLLAEISKSGKGCKDTKLVRARMHWQRINRQTRLPVPIPDSTLEKLTAGLSSNITPPRGFDLPSDNSRAHRFTWKHVVPIYEVGPDRHAQPESIYHWLETAIFDSFDQIGLSLERRLALNFLVLQSRHDTQIFFQPKNGDNIHAVTRLVEVKRLRASWMVDLFVVDSDGSQNLAVRDISTGVFLDAQGKLAPPPADELKDLIANYT